MSARMVGLAALMLLFAIGTVWETDDKRARNMKYAAIGFALAGLILTPPASKWHFLIGDWQGLGWYLLLAVILLAGIGIIYGERMSWTGFSDRQDTKAKALVAHYAWGVAQQAVLLLFLLPAFGSYGFIVAPLIFAVIHWPNRLLASVTLVGGIGSCLIFQDISASVLCAGIAHGTASAMIDGLLPEDVTLGMRIGRGAAEWKANNIGLDTV